MQRPLFLRAVRFALLAAVCWALPGCLESKNPVTPLADAQVDPHIIGTWYNDTPDGRGFLHLGAPGDLPDAPKGVVLIVDVGHDPGGSLSVGDPNLAFTSTVGGKTYLNVMHGHAKKIKKDKDPAGYNILYYTIQGENLSLVMADEDFVRAEIKAKNIEGQGARLTDTTENIGKWIEANHEKLFPLTKDSVLQYSRLPARPK